MPSRKYKSALFIGRFQPFHKGHLYSLKKCLEIADRVIVVVAKSNVSGTENDPWEAKWREQMVIAVVDAEGIKDRVGKICSCPDNPSDDVWLENIRKLAGNFDVVVSNNEWVLQIMRDAGYPTFETGLFNREELEGVKIRKMMREGDEKWRERVPKEVVKIIGD